MTASPAQVANDMAAQWKYWVRRDLPIGTACHQAADLIRSYLNGEQPDDNTVTELRCRLDELWHKYSKRSVLNNPSNSLFRAMMTIDDLRRTRAQSK